MFGHRTVDERWWRITVFGEGNEDILLVCSCLILAVAL
jgi:hypothetical protein